MKIKVNLPGTLRLEKLCPGTKGGAVGREVIKANFASEQVQDLEPGSYSIHNRYGGQPKALFNISLLTGLLQGWLGEPAPDCIEEVLS